MEASLGSHSYGQLSYHIIFVTKYRRPSLKDYADELKLILNEITIEHRMKLYAIEVAKDHIHMFISIRHTLALSYAIQLLKGKSAYLLLKAHPEIKQQFRTGHLWSKGKFIRSVGSVTEESIRRYIADSKHHDV